MESVGRIYAIGDIHGMLKNLLDALNFIREDAKEHMLPFSVVFLGDYVDRSQESREVVELVKHLTDSFSHYHAIKGNHEDMMVTFIESDGSQCPWWLPNGGTQTLNSYEGHGEILKEHVAWLKALPVRYDTEKYLFVHAGVDPMFPLDQQKEEVLMWTRRWNEFDELLTKHVVYGHTPFKKPLLKQNSSGIDTGACYGGSLTVAVFDAAAGGPPLKTVSF